MTWTLRLEALVFVAGAGVWFAVYFFAAIRFAASDQWSRSVWWIAVPVLWGVSLLYVLTKYTFKKEYDKFIAARWDKKGWKGEPPRLSEEPVKSLFMFTVSVLFLRFFSVCILVTWVPMATLIFQRGPVTHTFVVKALNARTKGPDMLEFRGHYWTMSGVPNPPDAIWNTAKPGDKVRLHGTGNRWGVFYSEIELIK